MSNNLYYCKKCGRIILDKNQCDCCKSQTFPVPEKYWLDGLDFMIDNKTKQALIEELVKNSPEFDQYLFDHRDEILAKQSTEFNAKMAHGKSILEEQSNSPKCPTCGSSNVQNIGTGERVASVAMFGLLSKKINKSFKCNNCGYTW